MNPKAEEVKLTIYEVCKKLAQKENEITILTWKWKDYKA